MGKEACNSMICQRRRSNVYLLGGMPPESLKAYRGYAMLNRPLLPYKQVSFDTYAYLGYANLNRPLLPYRQVSFAI